MSHFLKCSDRSADIDANDENGNFLIDMETQMTKQPVGRALSYDDEARSVRQDETALGESQKANFAEFRVVLIFIEAALPLVLPRQV